MIDKKITKKLVKLNLGSGSKRINGFVNVDKFKHPNVDIVHDLNVFPYPFKSDSVDYIFMSHALEHLDNPFNVLLECHRILKLGCELYIVVPHKDIGSAYDVAHRFLFHEWSLSHVLKNKNIGEGGGLQGNAYFTLKKCYVKRVIPTPLGFIPGFNLYHNAVGIGVKSEIHWVLRKNKLKG